MKFIIDANIVFSGILNTNSKIGDLLTHSSKFFSFIAPDYLRHEIKAKYSKIIKISGMSIEQVQEAEYQVTKEILFISEVQIPSSIWILSEQLVSDIDPKDIAYVAFAKKFKCKIWSGDKVLMNGLKIKNFHDLVTTEEIYLIRETLKSKV